MADIDPQLIAALLARAPTSNIGLANEGYGPDTGASVRAYEPSLKDRLARLLLGERPDEARMGAADAMLGTRGFGPSSPLPLGLSASDLTPVGPGLDFLDKSASGNVGGAMMSGAAAGMMAPGIGGRVMNEVGGAVGGAVDAGRSGMARIAEMLTARPATATAAGATGAVLGSTPEAGEARVDHPDRPKPPASPPPLPSYADYLKGKQDADRERLGAAYGPKNQARTAAAAESEYARLKVEYDKQAAAHQRAMDEWATRAAQFDKDQAERERQATYKDSFAERHPIANTALVGAGYAIPFAVGRRATNALNSERASLLDKFNTARTASQPSVMADSALKARALETTPSSGWDNIKTMLAMGGPAEAQSLGRVIDMASTGSDTEAYKKAQGDLTSSDYYLKLLPQLMAGGFAYATGSKLPLPGRADLARYDKGAYTSMMRDHIPRATEPVPGTFGMMSRRVEPTPESTTEHIARILASGSRADANANIARTVSERRAAAAEAGEPAGRWLDHRPDGTFMSLDEMLRGRR